MKHFLGASLLFATAAQLSFCAVYTQPPLWSGNGAAVGTTWTSQSDASVNGFRAFDNFSLASPSVINQVSWIGFYFDSTTGFDAAPNTDTWSIRFSADNAGIPGSTLQSTTLTAAQVNRVVLGTGLYGAATVTLYQFTADLPDFGAASGTVYWFSALSRATTFDPLFTWIEGTGGDGSSFQTGFTAGVVTDSFVREGDRAFSLADVPEPATSALAGLGLTLLALRGYYARRAREE